MNTLNGQRKLFVLFVEFVVWLLYRQQGSKSHLKYKKSRIALQTSI